MTLDALQSGWMSEVFGVSLTAADGGGQGVPVALAALEPALLAAIRLAPDERNTLMGAWDAASVRARAGDAAGADKLISSLHIRLDKIVSADARSDTARFGIPEGIAASRRAELEAFFAGRIEAAKASAHDEISKLTSALDELIENPEALVGAIGGQIAALLEELRPDIDGALRTGDEAGMAKAVAEWHARIAAEPRIAELRRASVILGCLTDIDGVIDVLSRDATAELSITAN